MIQKTSLHLLKACFSAILFIIVSTEIHAQSNASNKPGGTLQGIVLDLNSNIPMEQVIVTNLSTGLEIESGKEGVFEMPASLNDLLTFYYPGYRKDTLFVSEFELKRVYLTSDGEGIRIDEVNIRFLSDAQLEIEIEKAKADGKFMETSQSQGGLRLSPSRIFSREAKQARERHPLLLQEKERRTIDRRFSAKLIQEITPLTGDDLQIFMANYRPTKDFILNSDDQTFRIYIMDSYAAFKKLTPEEKAKLSIKQLEKNII